MNDGDAESSGGVTLDGALRAIVAADRLQLSDAASGKHLLHRRLTVFYGYFALLAVLAAVAGRFRHVLADVDPRIFHFVATVQIAHACVLGIVFAALRFRVRGVTFMRALDVLATAATAGTAAVALSLVPHVVSVDVSAVAFFVLFFVVRAALVPSQPWIATAFDGVSAIPFVFGLSAMYRHAGPAFVPDPDAATFAALRSMAAGVFGVYVVSKTIYGLRSAVERAIQLGQYVVHENMLGDLVWHSETVRLSDHRPVMLELDVSAA